jgi:alkylation response protein AidB-like acyl-CoA dehydrogenase
MQWVLNEEQEMLKTMAKDFMAKESPRAHFRAMSENEVGYSPALWKKMADLGWLGLTLPEQYGGAAMNFRDFAILVEEMGRGLLPAPFLTTAVWGGMLINAYGTEEQKKEWLPKIANGDAIFTTAFLEEEGDLWPGGINVRATGGDGEYRITGTKFFVTDAKAANYFLVAARTAKTDNPEDGITLFIVDGSEWGIYIKKLETMDLLRKQSQVDFTRVVTPSKNIIGGVNKGWPIIKDLSVKMIAALCAEMLGGMEWVMDTTVEYAKTRIAFGVPIGSFQIIKHKCADMKVALDYSRALMEWAVESIRDGEPDADLSASMAKAYCGDNYRFMTNHSIQIHGGIGFTWDHDLHFYFKRARSADTWFGDAAYHRELLARHYDRQITSVISSRLSQLM